MEIEGREDGRVISRLEKKKRESEMGSGNRGKQEKNRGTEGL